MLVVSKIFTAMKKILTIISCLAFASQVDAQSGDPHFSLAKGRVYSEREKQKLEYGVYVKNGNVMQVSNGQEVRMYDSMTLLDGSKVLPDGTILRLDGTKNKLNDGQRISLNGQISNIPKDEYVTMNNGRMTIVKDTIWIVMDRDLMLENGNRVFVQGYVVSPDGRKVPFNEGDKMSLAGTWMNDQPVFNSKLLQCSVK